MDFDALTTDQAWSIGLSICQMGKYSQTSIQRPDLRLSKSGLYIKVVFIPRQLDCETKTKPPIIRAPPIFNFYGLGRIFYGCIDFFLILKMDF